MKPRYFSSSIQKENTMSITKTKNGIYRLRMYIPEEAKSSLGIDKKVIEKRFKTRSEAKKYELEFQNKIEKVLSGETMVSSQNNGSILFSDSIKMSGGSLIRLVKPFQPPTRATIANTEIVFRKHILPMFANYSLEFLNQNKQVVLNLLTQKDEEYANFNVIRSYVNSIFDWAEELEYIQTNCISKTIKRIKATKKIKLQEAKKDEDLYLSQSELQAWFTAFEQDLKAEKILFKYYVLFYTTFFLGDRKSGSYALQWKHIGIRQQEIQLVQALDKYKQKKSTKGNKKTKFGISIELANLLQTWKKQQKYELAKFSVIQTDE